MPYSFTKIEEDKSKAIVLVFIFLIVFYFLSALILYAAVKISFLAENFEILNEKFLLSLTLKEIIVCLLFALVVGAIHWSVTAGNLIERMLNILNAEPLNPKDNYHSVLCNILEEVSVATGGKNIEGVVIPTAAMNAFALSDFKGRAVIGVTEGLLARLSRSQLEAVIGHEAAHIVTGDCLATTVTTSLFKLYGSAFSGLNQIMGEARWSRGRGRVGGYAVVIYIVLAVINFFGSLLNMLISRQREYRADAVAVRLTRDPLSLAEALYMISHRWRGASLSGQELEAIFIVNPRLSALDEGENLISDLFSTHPPIEKRIKILLGLAHSGWENLEEEAEKKTRKIKQMAPEGALPVLSTTSEWLINKAGQWVGPYSLVQLMTFDWLRSDFWVKKIGGEHVAHAYEDEELKNIFVQDKVNPSKGLCPHCRLALNETGYEGTQVLKCPQCFGILVSENDAARILIREDFQFSERIERMAEIIQKEQLKISPRKIDLKTVNFLDCPHDHTTKMMRMFYSQAYFIEIDKCIFCGSIWFDRDELEILQCLIEKQRQKQQV